MRGVAILGLFAVCGCGETERGVFQDPFPDTPATAGSTASGGTGGSGGGFAVSGGGGAGGGEPEPVFDPPSPITQPITKQVKSAGCGLAFDGAFNKVMTIRTSGRKDSNCADMLDGNPVCGSWSTLREYFVYLPTGYDIDKPYPLIFQAPGCGGGAQDVYSLSGNVSNTVIRVGLAPGPNSTGHGTNENQRCFDDKEGDDSIDWVFYEKLYDQLNQQLCFDRNRVFALGNSSGAWLANELGCKYAGDSLRPIRGIGAHAGGLPTEAKFVPHCTTAPLAGFWVHEVNNLTTPFSSAKVAITRAMATAGCALNSSYDNASFESFPIGGGVADGTCQRIVGCDPLIPLVVCPLPGNNHGSNDNVVNNGFSTFVKLFSAGSFITQ